MLKNMCLHILNISKHNKHIRYTIRKAQIRKNFLKICPEHCKQTGLRKIIQQVVFLSFLTGQK